MPDRIALAERMGRIRTAIIEGSVRRALARIDDPTERILIEFAHRYAVNAAAGNLETAVDALEWALAAFRADTDLSRERVKGMRERCAKTSETFCAFTGYRPPGDPPPPDLSTRQWAAGHLAARSLIATAIRALPLTEEAAS